MKPDIFLMRHPRPSVAEGLCYGQLDIPLLPNWQASLEQHMALLQGCRAIISSPLSRCRLPAAWLSDRLDCPLEINPALMELDFGHWEGRSWQSIDSPEARAWGDDFLYRSPPAGESFLALAKRVRNALSTYQDRPGPLLILSHGGPIRVLLADAQGKDLRRAFDQTLAFAQPYRLDGKPLLGSHA